VSAADVTIVMLAKNERLHLERSIPAVLGQETDLTIRLCIIDSGSTDGSTELVERRAASDDRVRLHRIEPHEFHHAGTRNLGASLAEGRYLVYLGGDAVPVDQHWLANLVRPVREDQEGRVAASHGRQVARPGTGAANRCRIAYNYGSESRLQSPDTSRSRKELYFFSSVSCCIDLERAESPLFDEDIPVNEDWTLSTRLIRDGWCIAYAADSVVEHSHEYTRTQILRRSFDNGVLLKRLGILSGRDGAVRREGVSYLTGALRELRDEGPAAQLDFAIFFAVSGLGVQLGLHSRWLPRTLRQWMSPYGTAG